MLRPPPPMVVSACSAALCLRAASSASSQLPSAALGALAHVWVGPLAVLEGISRYGSSAFSIWQPFRGSRSFVIMQAFGWFLYAVAILLDLVLLRASWFDDALARSRPFALARGAFSASASATLAASLRWFEQPKEEEEEEGECDTAAVDKKRLVFRHPLGLTSIALAVMASLSLLACDLAPRVLVTTLSSAGLDLLVACAIIASSLAAALTHGFLGPAVARGYRLYAPFEGGYACVILQGFSWTLFAMAVYAGAVLVSTGVERSAREFPGLLIVCCAFGLAAQLCLLSSLRAHVPPAEKPTERGKGAKRMSSGGGHGRATGVEALSVLFLACSALAGVLADALKEAASLAEPMQVTGAVLLTAAAPVANMAGTRLHPSVYRLWQPFRGGTPFVVAQGFAWTLLASSLVVTLANGPGSAAYDRLAWPLGATALGLMLRSLWLFDPSGEVPFSRRSRAWAWSELELFSAVCALCGLCAGFGLDVAKSVVPSTAAAPAMCAAFAFCAASAGAAHTAGRARHHPHYALFMPFQGGSAFVTRQAIAWTVLSVGLAAMLVLAANPSAASPLATLTAAATAFADTLLLSSLRVFEPPHEVQLSAEGVAVAFEGLARLAPERRSAARASVSRARSVTTDPLAQALLRSLDAALKTEDGDDDTAAATASAAMTVGEDDNPARAAGDRATVLILASGAAILTAVAAPYHAGSVANAKLLLVLGLAMSVISAGLTQVVLGRRAHPPETWAAAHVWTGAGGARYLLLQCIGASLFSLGALLKLTALAFPGSPAQWRGLLPMAALASLVATLVLMYSVAVFERNTFGDRRRTSAVAAAAAAAGPASSLEVGPALGLVLSLSSLALFVAADAAIALAGGRGSTGVLLTVLLATLGVFGSVPLSLALDGAALELGRTRLRTPELAGVALWSCAVVLGGSLCALKAAPVGALSTTGLSGVAAHLLVIASLREHQQHARMRRAGADETAITPALIFAAIAVAICGTKEGLVRGSNRNNLNNKHI